MARDGSGGVSWGWIAMDLSCSVKARVSKQVLRKMTGGSVENWPDQGAGLNCCRRPSLDEENLNYSIGIGSGDKRGEMSGL